MSLYTWNTTQMNQHKTQYLFHHNYYEDMQSLLTQAIIEIHSSIIETNDESNMHTPTLGTRILHKQNASRDSHRTRFGRPVDGLHPNEQTKIHWAGEILQSIMINRVNHRQKTLHQIIFIFTPLTIYAEPSTITHAHSLHLGRLARMVARWTRDAVVAPGCHRWHCIGVVAGSRAHWVELKMTYIRRVADRLRCDECACQCTHMDNKPTSKSINIRIG